MAWYDWVLWLGILYMFLGTDFTLNWLSGVGFGRRLDRDSPNFIARIYYRVWAATDPNARADRVDGPEGILAPWVTAVCVTNALATCTIEILLLYGMLQDTIPPYVMPAAFAFLLRAVIEIIYGSQLIWGSGTAAWRGASELSGDRPCPPGADSVSGRAALFRHGCDAAVARLVRRHAGGDSGLDRACLSQ